MKRIMVIGCCGAGKSTFSRTLQAKLQLPLIHLDQHYWKPNWTETEPQEWTQKVKELVQGDEWIIDGNYSGTMEILLARADTVFYIDATTGKALYRILKRSLTNWRKVRPDMPSRCPERFSWQFIRYVYFFNQTRKDKILRLLDAQPKNKVVHILTSNKAIKILG